LEVGTEERRGGQLPSWLAEESVLDKTIVT